MRTLSLSLSHQRARELTNQLSPLSPAWERVRERGHNNIKGVSTIKYSNLKQLLYVKYADILPA
jgi:hypothetical protein